MLGTNDLVKELGAAHTPDRVALVASLGLCLLAARAEGLVCVDGVYNAFQDQEGLRAACVQGREMGFDGKTLIHPDQIAVANEVFAPSADDLALAREQVAAFEAAEARGEGVAVVNGRIVENLHVVTRPAAARAGRGDRRAGGGAMTLLVLGLIALDAGPSSSSGWRRTRGRALDGVARRRAGAGRDGGAARCSGLVLIVVGYRRAPFVPVYDPPSWGIHLNNLLMLCAVGLLGAGPFQEPGARAGCGIRC